jgi:hypothetical protein
MHNSNLTSIDLDTLDLVIGGNAEQANPGTPMTPEQSAFIWKQMGGEGASKQVRSIQYPPGLVTCTNPTGTPVCTNKEL